jgi:hypothetical protein
VFASSEPQSFPKVTRSQSPKHLPPLDLEVLDESLEQNSSPEKSPASQPTDSDMEIVEDIKIDSMEGQACLKLDSNSLDPLLEGICPVHLLCHQLVTKVSSRILRS